MVIGDSAYIKKINRSLILQKIIEHEYISRADLSKITGLNKATISVQVADLLDEGLIVETQQEHNNVGRRPIMLSINEQAGFVLGVDFNYQQLMYTVSNLKGISVQQQTVVLESEAYETVIEQLIEDIHRYQANYADSRYGLVSVTIGVHGTVNKETESIRFFPAYNWHQKNIKTDLEKALDIPIAIENNANLSAYAEKVYHYHESTNLLSVILTSGIGSGIIIDGNVHKGYHGYAGEMGHMIISPDGELCRCGNHGCWELYASEPKFLEKLAIALNLPSITIAEVETLRDENNPVVCEHFERLLHYLSIGLNNVINLYNPETIVLNSRLLHVFPNSIDRITEHLPSSVSQYREITLSQLGNNACGMGACALGIQHFLDVSEMRVKAAG
ncbi:ROK family transcriptional regulator [Caldibacillus lycopersici]|uniref:ROK family transcriptional regulator n=1 Tax=Perspicuibacillus lycopersici TaxID=1325689 RepID=A0AAE3IV66_9BACI|nr:ROK family transcriptional regulator [Perspicuibacillus lycopersici]MCU9615188.1 ROK family transcriptional regulator [Perspicuibacillus lycopersici]